MFFSREKSTSFYNRRCLIEVFFKITVNLNTWIRFPICIPETVSDPATQLNTDPPKTVTLVGRQEQKTGIEDRKRGQEQRIQMPAFPVTRINSPRWPPKNLRNAVRYRSIYIIFSFLQCCGSGSGIRCFLTHMRVRGPQPIFLRAQ